MINRFCAFIFCVILVACSKANGTYSESHDDVLRIEAIKTKEGGELNFKVRITPEKAISKQHNEQIYEMDSCFYLSKDAIKTYPTGITPIGNGSSKSFEYLVYFNESPEIKDMVLVYQDRFISQNRYQLSFK